MHESAEDYLETIFILKKRCGRVRSVDIAQELGFSRASISRAIGLLRDRGLATMEQDGSIELTESGREAAAAVYEKHTTLTRFLMAVTGVSADIAERDACRIEHIISPQTFAGIKAFLERHADLQRNLAEPVEYRTREGRV